MKKNKRGEVPATGAIVALVVGVSVAVLILMFTATLGAQTFVIVQDDIDDIGVDDGTATFTIKLNASNTNTTTLTGVPIVTGSDVVRNGTAGTILVLGSDYSLNRATGVLKLLNVSFNNTPLSATWEYGDTDYRDAVKASVTSSFQAQEQTGNYMPIIMLAIVITLVLGLVMGFAGGGGKAGDAF